jgi:hypothetical protein
MIGFIAVFYYSLSQLQSITTAHSQWLPKTHSIPASAFSICWAWLGSDLRDGHFFISAVRWLALHSWTHNLWILLRLNDWTLESGSESHVTTDGQSASLSWNKAPIWGLKPDFYYSQEVAGLLMWGALSDEWTGQSFATAQFEIIRSTNSHARHIELSESNGILMFHHLYLQPLPVTSCCISLRSC